MITVQILINGAVILARSARNVDPKLDAEESTYKVDDGSTIKHKRSDGAVKLAKAMLDTIKEP
jgi:hypothetical protein